MNSVAIFIEFLFYFFSLSNVSSALLAESQELQLVCLSHCINSISILNARSKLSAQNRDAFLELEDWLSDGDDEILTLNRNESRKFPALLVLIRAKLCNC